MKVIKEYPNYIFINDKGKQVKFSINGDSPLIGWSGRRVQNFPAGCDTNPFGYGFSKLYSDWGSYRQEGAQILDLLDKLVSVDSNNLNLSMDCIHYGLHVMGSIERYVGFKTFLKAYQMVQQIEEFKDYHISSRFLDTLQYTVFCLQYPNIRIPDNFDKTILYDLSIYDTEKFDVSLEKLITFYSKYVYSPIGQVIGERTMRERIGEYLQWCKDLHWKPETGDFFQNYLKAKNTWIAMKDQIADEIFANSQAKRNIFYETEDFITIIPTTRKECIDEGNNLHNCLGGIEWNNYLSTGRRNVVFVRRKNDINRSYIACDIDIENGWIKQFLSYCNNTVMDQDAQPFRKSYQEYLLNLWKDTEGK